MSELFKETKMIKKLSGVYLTPLGDGTVSITASISSTGEDGSVGDSLNITRTIADAELTSMLHKFKTLDDLAIAISKIPEKD